MDWFLYDNGLRLERVKPIFNPKIIPLILSLYEYCLRSWDLLLLAGMHLFSKIDLDVVIN